MRTLRSVGVLAAVGGLMLASGGGGRGQQVPCSNAPCMSTPSPSTGTQQGSHSPQIPSPLATDPDTSQNPRMEQDQAKMRNMERQKKLVDDTEKLLALATELKTDVDKSNKDTLSLDVIRKADEIEKLAHSVKEKMKGT